MKHNALFVFLLAITLASNHLLAQEDLQNQNLNNVNHLTINDPGPNEGIQWLQTNANWTMDVSPLNRSNTDGNLNIYGTSNNIVFWRPIHIYSSTAGDAILTLEADVDNNDESDNSRIQLLQDDGDLGAFIGFNKDWGGTWEPDNVFRIGTRYAGVDNYNRLVIKTSNGNVGIGVSNPDSKLVVDGKIRSEEVKVEIINGADYVFEPNYELRTLQETKAYITEHQHLPEIPSATEMEANGIDLGDMNMRLLKKIEELTLYQIELLERLESVEARNKQMEEKLKKITSAEK